MNGLTVTEINLVSSTIAAIGGLLIALSIWRRRSQQVGSTWFVRLVFSVSWLSLWYAIEAAGSADLGAFITASKFEYLGLTLIPVAWLGFTLEISGHEPPFSRRVLLLLLAIPVTTLVLVFTNELHGLIWARPAFAITDAGPVFAPRYGPAFWVYTFFAYILFLAGTVVLVRHTLGTWQLYRAQALLVLAGTLFPWISNFLEIFDELNPLPALQLNSICLTIAITTYAIGIFRLSLLDIAPLSEDVILSHMPGSYIVTDARQRVVALNRNMEAHIDSRDVIGKPLNVVLPSFPAGIKPDGQSTLWQSGGRTVEVSAVPILNWRKNRRGTLYLLNDVTEREQAHSAQRASEARQQALLEALPDMIFRIRQDGTLVDIHAPNPHELLAPPADLLNRRVTDFIPTPLSDEMLRVNEQVLRTGIVGSLDYSLEIDGQPLDFEARTVASGEDEVVVIIRNITDRKQAEQRAFALALERERVSLLTRFIQESSHEFRTPLSIIEVSLHLLQRLENAADRAERLEQIGIQVGRITHLVDILVHMSRLDSGVALEMQECAVNTLVEQAAINQQAAAAAKQLRLECQLAENLPALKAAPNELLNALIQLIDNAVRYTPEGAGTIVLRTEQRDGMIAISVDDPGVGIPESALPHVFERFYRLDSAHSTPGFGLGLSIAQKIIELHGGTIQAASSFGHGSRFTIYLPAGGADEANSTANPRHEQRAEPF